MMNGFVWILSAVMWGKVLCMCGVDASCVRTLTALSHSVMWLLPHPTEDRFWLGV